MPGARYDYVQTTIRHDRISLDSWFGRRREPVNASSDARQSAGLRVTADTLLAFLGTPPADVVEVGPFVAWRREDGHGLEISTVYAGRDPGVCELAEIIGAAHQRWYP